MSAPLLCCPCSLGAEAESGPLWFLCSRGAGLHPACRVKVAEDLLRHWELGIDLSH